ncbi:putative protein [Arabidopsis thaliana]|uniref:1-phosphatidylinositol 4-kinase n=3 Tax=Arabidopsis thaliana TaxID=3702 RepID=Q9LXW4_ARATH|nr:Protein kinase superfamily protein [Arabidopsis thaliana]ABE65495.1 hypothetical protein At3g43950 [Arabidopsis thaliana]AEE77848.1 Protein kinase superfamily protein [Arabidopsis thaliana]CAB88123.1 putative protein [Arabidopsis thaliana]VYS59257.1 unnamed protein product [Arabidopsis thaliana]|eukprot:NP_189981.1 Protein kinase superfamily protein [Arabidopsis thaliana]
MAGCSMMKVDRTFPDLKEIPVDLATRFRQMIEWLEIANSECRLTPYKKISHIYQIFHSQGVLECLFRRGEDDISFMIEASVYLLDHPLDGSRSSSPTICDFAGVLPTIFVTFRNKRLGTMVSGASVEFMEFAHHIQEHIHRTSFPEIRTAEIHKISLIDVRFGNMDRNAKNIIVKVEDNIPHFVPIDHEMCFINTGQNYNLCKPYWLSLEDSSIYEA